MDAINPGSPAIGSDNPAATYDESYQFGRRPNVRAPWPFTDRQFARLEPCLGGVDCLGHLSPSGVAFALS